MPRKTSSKAASSRLTTIPMTKARVNLGALVTRVHLNKDYITLEKDGVPITGIMDIDEFEDYLEIQDTKVRAVITKGRQEYLAGQSRLVEDLLHELQDRQGGKHTRRQHPCRHRFLSGPSPSLIASYVASVDSIQNVLMSMPKHSRFCAPLRITGVANTLS
jgi:hypothetical protein